MKTARGIYLDINESDYYYDYKIGSLSLRFYFSSKVYCEKFKKRLPDYILKNKIRLFGYDENPYFNMILNSGTTMGESLIYQWAIEFYKSIEKRGFKVIKKEGDSSCQVHQ